MIAACNIRNYTIFLKEPENLMFAYFEYHGTDFAADAAKMAADPKTQEWWSICMPMQAPLADPQGGRVVGRDGRRVSCGLSDVTAFDPLSLAQTWPAPSSPRPVVTFGAGSIVGDAHFPAYRKSGVPIAGLYDPDHDKARRRWPPPGTRGLRHAWRRPPPSRDAIFDLATPPAAHAEVLAGTARRRRRADPEADGRRSRGGDRNPA